MINFKITNLETGSLTVVKPSGKPIPLTQGEVVEAKVVEVLPSGEVTLKIKGGFLTAKAEIQGQMQKDMTALFKVLDTPVEGKELKLQFLGAAGKEISPQPGADAKADGLAKLIAELAEALTKGDGKVNGKTLDGLLKSLPQDSASLPKEIRAQLQDLLQASLKSEGGSIKGRLDALFNKELPKELQDLPLVKDLKSELMLSMEKLLSPALKSALQDTGVALEAKLKNIAELLLKMEAAVAKAEEVPLQKDTAVPKGATELPGGKAAGAELPGDQVVQAAIKNDLKAGLLKLQELLTEKGTDLSLKTALPTREGDPGGMPAKALLQNIDGLLKDIDTFQALSRATDSFYTFLPLNWKELKDGEIAFKKGREGGGKGSAFSCRINLDMEEHGKLNVLVLVHGGEFFVTFKAEDKAFQSAIGSHMKELQDSFRERGLYLKGTTVLDFDDPSFDQLERLDPVDKLVSIKV